MNVLLDYNQPTLTYASISRRFLAYCIDFAIIGVLEGICSRILGIGTGSVATFFIGMAYFVILETSESRATFGKSLLNLYVADTDGNTISTTTAIVRYVMKVVSTFLFFIGVLLALMSSRKQSLHDIIAGTIVLERS